MNGQDDNMTGMEPEGTRPSEKELCPENPEDKHEKPDKETQEHIDKTFSMIGKPKSPDFPLYYTFYIYCSLIEKEDWFQMPPREVDEKIKWYIKLAYTMAERLNNHQP